MTDINLNGFIKSHRSLLAWEWHDDPPMLSVWIHLLHLARFTPGSWHGKKIDVGQVWTSIPTLSKLTGLSSRQVRTCITRLKSTGEVTDKTTSTGRLITVVNWAKYQDRDDDTTDQTTCDVTDERQTSDRRTTDERQQRKNKRTKERKEGKEEYDTPTKLTLGTFQNVHITEAEYAKLIDYCGGESSRDGYIERLSGWLQQISPAEAKKKYSSHYATIQNWVRRDGAKGGKQDGRKDVAADKGTRYGTHL